jgi:hypothetical protein
MLGARKHAVSSARGRKRGQRTKGEGNPETMREILGMECVVEGS